MPGREQKPAPTSIESRTPTRQDLRTDVERSPPTLQRGVIEKEKRLPIALHEDML